MPDTAARLDEIIAALIDGDEAGADAIAGMTPEEFARAFGGEPAAPPPEAAAKSFSDAFDEGLRAAHGPRELKKLAAKLTGKSGRTVDDAVARLKDYVTGRPAVTGLS